MLANAFGVGCIAWLDLVGCPNEYVIKTGILRDNPTADFFPNVNAQPRPYGNDTGEDSRNVIRARMPWPRSKRARS